MFHLDNNSGVSSMPAPAAAQNTTPRWFTEGAGSVPPSWPGQDWYNIVQAELLAVLAAAGIVPDKSKLNQLALSIKVIANKDALLKVNLLSEIKTAGASSQKTAIDNLGLTQTVNLAGGALQKDKNLSDVPNKPQARKNLELGTAATSNVQKSAADNTVNAVLTVGAFGLGGNSIPITTASNSDLSKMPGIPFNAIREYKSSDGSVYLIGMSGISPSGNLVEWLAPENGSDGKKLAVRNKDSLFILYSTANKPTANDVGALPVAGGTMAGAIKVSSTGHGSFASQNSGEAPIFQPIDTGQTSEYWPIIKQRYKQANATWSAGMLVSANRFLVHYQDAAGGSALFSFYKDGQFIPGNYANFDAKYQPKGNYALAGASYTKAESDGRYYTKVQSDAGYQPKGNYALVGTSFTKAESDARYVQDTRMGANMNVTWGAQGGTVPAGCSLTGGNFDDDREYAIYAYMQKKVNGTWYNCGRA